jgi:hypothetical protein
VKTTTLKKPCKDCPYRATSKPFDYNDLDTEKQHYDKTIVHDCHKLSHNYSIVGEGLGCLGSKMWGEKLENPNLYPFLKEIKALDNL